MLKKEKRVIFIRVGWMEYYGLIDSNERPIGGGSYNDHSIGSEAKNFKKYNNKLFGYVQVNSKNNGINISRVWSYPHF